MEFTKWLDRFIEEKGIDTYDTFSITSGDCVHMFDYEYVLKAIKQAPENEQKQIKRKLIQIDFLNGDVTKFLEYLAQALC